MSLAGAPLVGAPPGRVGTLGTSAPPSVHDGSVPWACLGSRGGGCSGKREATWSSALALQLQGSQAGTVMEVITDPPAVS